MAIQKSLRHFLEEVNGRQVTIFTDHLPLVGVFKKPKSMQHDHVATGHIIEVSQVTTDVRYLQGKSNAVADALSRPPAISKETPVPIQNLTPLAATAAVQEVYFQTVDHKALAADQKTCAEVAAHRAGKHPKGLIFKDVEFSPGNWLLCDVSDTKKSKATGPKTTQGTNNKDVPSIEPPGTEGNPNQGGGAILLAQDETGYLKLRHKLHTLPGIQDT